jgi:S1-C subfamily serine protease
VLLKRLLKVLVLISLLIGSIGAVNELLRQGELVRRTNIENNIKAATVALGACPYATQCGGGTGFVIAQSEQGAFIITNKHVCEVAKRNEVDRTSRESLYIAVLMTIIRQDGKQASGQILRLSQNTDLCLVYTPMKFKHTLPLAKSYKIGDLVTSYGFPNGGPLQLRGTIKKHDFYGLGIYNESDMLAWYGISGSAVTNIHGEVVGVMSNLLSNDISSMRREAVYGSLFIPLELLQEFVTGVIK